MTQDDILICTMFIAAILTPLVKNKLGKWLIIVASKKYYSIMMNGN